MNHSFTLMKTEFSEFLIPFISMPLVYMSGF